MTINKKPEIKISDEDLKNLKTPKSMTWRKSQEVMTEEEIDKFKNMNWEWYYNCYIFLDVPTPVACKRCEHTNIFPPWEKIMKCENCGAECKRCEKEEDLGDRNRENERNK